MVMTRGKRVVRVMMDLSQSQEEDKPLPYSSTQLVRYNLLHYPEINHVKVNHPHPPGFDYGLTIHFLDMPRFLGSQLEAQEITNGSSLWLHVQPVLTFIARNLSHPPKSPACPTLFFLHSRENHRTYFFFAFVGMKMTSRSYSPGELLHMRQTPTVEGLARHLRSVLRENTDLR